MHVRNSLQILRFGARPIVRYAGNLYHTATVLLSGYLRNTKMVQRVTYRRQTPYNTRSNRVRIVKTPGNTLRYQHLKKLGSAPKCGDCGIALPGIPALRPREYSNISKPKKTVQRAYGGSRCANCVHDRVIRAFLIEEQQV